jgi:hypothetical protein
MKIHLVISPPLKAASCHVVSIFVDSRHWLTETRALAVLLAPGSAIAAYSYDVDVHGVTDCRPWVGCVPARRAEIRFAYTGDS